MSGFPGMTWRPRVTLRAALAGIVVIEVLATALLIHLSWAHTARQNVSDVAAQLNTQIVDSIRGKMNDVLNDAQAAEESIRSIFAQGAITPDDESKREFVFLAILQSQPALSWISFGWPNGDFFGVEKTDEEIHNIEVKWDGVTGKAIRRLDRYQQEPGDILFLERTKEPSTFSAAAQPWYEQAVTSDTTVWTMIHDFPDRRQPAISVSGRLILYKKFVGVIEVAIELKRLSQYLTGLHVGSSGTVLILDGKGGIVASPDPGELKAEDGGAMRDLSAVSVAESPLLVVARDAVTYNKVDLDKVKMAEPLAPFRAADGALYFVSLSSLHFQNWTVVTVIPEEDFLANIDRNTQRLLYGLAIFTLIMIAVAILLADWRIGRPLVRVAGQLRHIEGFRLDRITHVSSPLKELDNLSAALIQMAQGLTSFQKYLPTELVRTLVSQGIEAKPGGEQQVLTVLFSDLAGFTALSERLGPGIVPVLTDYLSRASHAIVVQSGTIDKFIGDAVMAFWGAPLRNDRHAEAACRAALGCQQALAGLRAPGEGADATELKLRIGINTGTMLVGNIGSEERLNYTVIGDAVNLASRLESLNKLYGTDIIIGEATRLAAGPTVVVRELDRVAVYGRTGSTAVFELLATTEAASSISMEWVANYEAGLAAYRQRRWDEAIDAFRLTQAQRPGGDKPSAMMVEQCLKLRADPPPADWVAVTVMGAK